jgi:hypothetical protein
MPSKKSGRPSAVSFPPAEISDRRSEPRLSAEVVGVDVEGRLTTGVQVRVVNVSSGGALLELQEWLRPGARTELRLARPADAADAGQFALPCHVARCWVSSLSPLRYRAALVFPENETIAPNAFADDVRTARTA